MSGLDSMLKRVQYIGGDTSDKRIVKGKLRSFLSSLTNSYQAEDIIFKGKQCRCLINPDKLTNDYDQKEISISFDAGMEAGDTFYWPRTNSHWISYLRRFEEEAYYRARIRRCDYSVNINGNEYWVYLRGPVETAILWRQKHQIEMNELNYSLIMYITNNEETNAAIHRHAIIKFDNHNWRVDAVDRYSTPGIIEVNLGEFYDNEFEDEYKEQQNKVEITTQPRIVIPKDIGPYDQGVKCYIDGIKNPQGIFYFKKDEERVKIVNQTPQECCIDVITGKSASISLYYRPSNKEEPIMGEFVIKPL